MRYALHVVVLLTFCGCATHSANKVAIFNRDVPPIAELIKPAPHTGLYKVQMTAGEKHLKTPLYLATRWVQKGESLGFRKDSEGSLVAVAGSNEIGLDPLPARATHVMWLNHAKKTADFGKSMKSAGEFLEKAAIVTVAGVGIVGAVALEVWTSSDDDRECADYGPPAHHHHRR